MADAARSIGVRELTSVEGLEDIADPVRGGGGRTLLNDGVGEGLVEVTVDEMVL